MAALESKAGWLLLGPGRLVSRSCSANSDDWIPRTIRRCYGHDRNLGTNNIMVRSGDVTFHVFRPSDCGLTILIALNIW